MNKVTLAEGNQLERCFKAATRYLGYRPRSEPELRERLRRRGFSADDIGAVIAKLKRMRLVDDAAFAEFWKDNRESFSPRSKSLTRLELKQKGISEDIIESTIATIDDEDSAYRAATSKARSLSRSDYESFRRRLGGYLQRRGFNYGVVEKTIKRVWQEGL